jgi:hypothetical protein
MKVKAKFTVGKFGFYGGIRRYDGDEFELSDPKHFSEKWMVKLDDSKRQRRPKFNDECGENGAE